MALPAGLMDGKRAATGRRGRGSVFFFHKSLLGLTSSESKG